eukprot:s3065_g5.t1
MDWIATLPADDIAARVQLPPVLTPLRGVLERVLQRRTDSNDWAALVAVAEAMAALCSGNQLAHQADVVAIAAGGFDSPLLEGGQGHSATTPTTCGGDPQLAGVKASNGTRGSYATGAGDLQPHPRRTLGTARR